MTLAEELSFSRLCHEELSREKTRDGIGLLEEKRLHSVLKRWVCDDFTAHEQKVCGRGEKPRRFVADVLTKEGEIFEIQTADLYPMRKKIAFYMEETDHRVTVVHPLIAKKEICWIHPETGETKKSRSTLREGVLHGVAQLKSFLPLLGDPRFAVVFPAIEVEEYRMLDGWGNGGKRGSHRYELLPRALKEVYRLQTREDYAAHLPEMPAEFTAKEFGKSTRLGGYALYDVLAVFEGLGILAKCGTRGRAALWHKAEG
ncbi:MAG: hypothetical protein E7624_02400 [Ruminococcaceae bacterium]|nr:hypothetical protein [Oscillospiraceae bacterium]